MSYSIKTHINFGNGAGPKPKPDVPAHGFVASGERKAAVGRVRRIIAGKSRPTPTDDEMYDFLLGFARRGERAPTLQEIQGRIGHGGDRVLRRLVRAGRISIYVGLKNYRVLTFGGTELKTLAPKGFKAYRRCDVDGDWWRGPKGWRQRSPRI